MKISLDWIREFTSIPSHYTPKQLSELLTLRTCEVEGYENVDPRLHGLEGVVVGEVLSFKKIEGSEKLHVSEIHVGRSEPIQVVFGSMIAMEVGKRVPVAVAPCKLPTGMEIQPKKIMGVLTEGMLCLDQELGLKKDGVSIQYFPNTAPGTSFTAALIHEQNLKYDNIAAGQIVSVEKHPNADRLSVARVNMGDCESQIVCGGKNLVPGMMVIVARPGAQTVCDDGTTMKIRAAKIRDVESNGMICAEVEVGLPVVTPQVDVTIADLTLVCKHFGTKTPTAGTPLADALRSSDVVFEVDNKSITHRPDLWSHYGMAREFAAFTGQKLKNFVTRVDHKDTGEAVRVEITEPEIASRFLSVIIKGIKIKPSPVWMQNRLKSVGMRPVNNVVDITNYVMLELGHPLHAFDRRVVGNDSFVIRRAHAGEVLETLDHKKRTLSTEDVLVTNGERALGLAGIMGGAQSEITEDTTEIILEVARWNPILIRKSSQRHNLRSDAAARFEKSLDPEYTGFAFHRACQLILKVCRGSELVGPATDIYPVRAETPTVLLSIEKLNSKIGIQLNDKEVAMHLKSLQFGVQKEKKGLLRVTVPTWRATKDVTIEDDLIEEVARMNGYEKLIPTLPQLPTRLPLENKERTLKNKARTLLSLGLGFNETMHYSFYGAEEIQRCMLPEQLHVQILNPLTTDQTHMRITLVPHLLRAAARNLHVRESVSLYEIGRTYLRAVYFPHEEKFIGGVVAHKNAPSQEACFSDARSSLVAFLECLSIQNVHVELAKTPPPYAHPKACAEIFAGDIHLATVYEIHPLVAKNYDLPSGTSAFELNFTRLSNLQQKPFVFEPLPRFPGISIDISVLVDERTTVRAVETAIRRVESPLIAHIELLSTFEDSATLGAAKKSLTFRILLQSPERTLTEGEMQEVRQKVIDSLVATGYAVR